MGFGFVDKETGAPLLPPSVLRRRGGRGEGEVCVYRSLLGEKTRRGETAFELLLKLLATYDLDPQTTIDMFDVGDPIHCFRFGPVNGSWLKGLEDALFNASDRLLWFIQAADFAMDFRDQTLEDIEERIERMRMKNQISIFMRSEMLTWELFRPKRKQDSLRQQLFSSFLMGHGPGDLALDPPQQAVKLKLRLNIGLRLAFP